MPEQDNGMPSHQTPDGAEPNDQSLIANARHQAEAAPRSPESTVAASITEQPGAIIGRYKLLQEIGTGGFGVVFLAEQDKPVRRRVALKIIKLGMDTRQVVARFDAERQALALMEHPHIAKVLDGGATESGRPYFVMEYVVGDPITKFSDAHKLSLPERLTLFQQVCLAIQHAHQKGIIHRDIKPRNVLVSMVDGKPLAKVIDFGIAKATGARLTDMTLFTEHRQLIGTPEYMSPEQAEGSPDIDTRTDVYSLGVVLYELLTGSTPFDSARLRASAMGEMQRIIAEEEPPAPSLRLSRSLSTLAATAAARRVEPAGLGALVRGELDWIVMKALEKDRMRRYDSAGSLSLDVERHLSGQPVQAAPPAIIYRARKMLRRYRGVAIASTLILASLVIGLFTTLWWAKEAQQLAREAKKNEEVALAKSVIAAKAESEANRKRDEVVTWSYAANIAAAQAAIEEGYVSAARIRLENCPVALRGWEWNYLNTLLDVSSSKIEFPKGEISMVLSPDESSLWIASAIGQLCRLRTSDFREMVRVNIPARWMISSGNPPQMIVSPDGKRCLAGMGGFDRSLGAQGQWLLLNAETLETLATIGTEDGLWAHWRFSPDSSLIAMIDLIGNSLSVRRSYDGENIADVPLPKGKIVDAAFSLDTSTLIVALENSDLVLWSVADHHVQSIPNSKGSRSNQFRISPDKHFIADILDDGTTWVWDGSSPGIRTLTTQMDPQINGSQSFVGNTTWSADSRLLAVTMRQSIAIWDVASNHKVKECFGNSEMGVHYLTFSQDRDWLLLRDSTEKISPGLKVWDTNTGELPPRLITRTAPGIQVWNVHTGVIALQASAEKIGGFECAEFGPDSDHVISASANGQIQKWSLKNQTPGEHLTLNGHAERVMQLCVPKRDSRFISASVDGTIRVWNSQKVSNPITSSDISLQRVRFGVDSDRVFVTGNKTRVMSAATGNFISAFSTSGSEEWNLELAAVDRTHEHVAYFTGDHALICDANTGQMVGRLGWPGLSIWTIALSDDFSKLACLIVDDEPGQAEVHVVDPSSGQTRWHVQIARSRKVAKRPNQNFGVIALSPSGTRLATPNFDKNSGFETTIWDTDSGNSIRSLPGPDCPSAFAFSPDSGRLAVGYESGRIRIWNVEDGSLGSELWGHTDEVVAMDFSPDTTRLVTAAENVRLWDSNRGVEVMTLPMKPPFSVAFSPDGIRLAVTWQGSFCTFFDSRTRQQVCDADEHHVQSAGIKLAKATLAECSDRIACAAARIKNAGIDNCLRRSALDALARIQSERNEYLIKQRREHFVQTRIVSAIKADGNLSAGAREEMLSAAKLLDPLSSDELNGIAWNIVVKPDQSAAVYSRALLAAQSAHKDDKKNGLIMNTLGAAQFRTGLFEDALKTLQQSDALNSKENNKSMPEDIAFIAMCHAKLGHKITAAEMLAKLRNLVKGASSKMDASDHSLELLKEAEGLIEGHSLSQPASVNSPNGT